MQIYKHSFVKQSHCISIAGSARLPLYICQRAPPDYHTMGAGGARNPLRSRLLDKVYLCQFAWTHANRSRSEPNEAVSEMRYVEKSIKKLIFSIY